MVSKLSKIISEIAEQNEIKVEGYNMSKIAAIERHLNQTGDIESAMSELDHVLGFHWDDYYGKIKKELERNK